MAINAIVQTAPKHLEPTNLAQSMSVTALIAQKKIATHPLPLSKIAIARRALLNIPLIQIITIAQHMLARLFPTLLHPSMCTDVIAQRVLAHLIPIPLHQLLCTGVTVTLATKQEQ